MIELRRRGAAYQRHIYSAFNTLYIQTLLRKTDFHRVFGYLWSVFGYFRFLNNHCGFGFSKSRGFGSVSVYRLNTMLDLKNGGTRQKFGDNTFEFRHPIYIRSDGRHFDFLWARNIVILKTSERYVLPIGESRIENSNPSRRCMGCSKAPI